MQLDLGEPVYFTGVSLMVSLGVSLWVSLKEDK